MEDFNNKILKIRKKWKYKRQGQDYTPFIHDKIKFNINYYLTRVALFFNFDSALILDADDLGTSVALKTVGFKDENIHIPNYYDKKSEYKTMKQHLKNIAVFPISIDDYVDAIIHSSSTQSFRSELKEKYNDTAFDTKPRLIDPLPSKPRPFNFIYLDYCNEYQSNKETIEKIFSSNILSEEYVFALTGSLMLKSKEYTDKLLKTIEKDVKKMSKTQVQLDQVFVYKRYHQEGLATQTIQHKDVEVADIHSTKMGMFMFFISFISSKNLDKYNDMFEVCTNGLCKTDIENKQCLFHMKEQVEMKPFCNNRVTDFYLLISPSEKSLKNAKEIIKDMELPYKIKTPDFLLRINKDKNWSNGILKTFNSSDVEMLNIKKIIKSTTQEFIKHQVFNINLKEKTYKISIECEINNCVGFSFVYENDLVNHSKNACFFVKKAKFKTMIVGFLKVNDTLSVRYKMKTDKKKLVGYQWFDGEIIKIEGDTYTIKFNDGTVERLILGNLEWKKKDDLIADYEISENKSSSDDSYISSNDERDEYFLEPLKDIYEENAQLKAKLQNAQKEMKEVLKKSTDIAIVLTQCVKDLNDLKVKYKSSFS